MDEHGTVNRRVEDFIAWVSDVTKPFVRTMHSLGQMLIREIARTGTLRTASREWVDTAVVVGAGIHGGAKAR